MIGFFIINPFKFVGKYKMCIDYINRTEIHDINKYYCAKNGFIKEVAQLLKTLQTKK